MGMYRGNSFPPVALPSILVHPEEVVFVFAGTAMSLVCVANGQPPPSISWFRNGMELVNGSFGSVLTIETVTLDRRVQSILDVCEFQANFSGNFSCQAHNPFGQQTVDFQLQVVSGTYFS